MEKMKEREASMLAQKLNKLKDKSGLNNQEIAYKSGVAVSTVQRIMSGQTASPSYQDVANIVVTLGGSLDALEGIEHPKDVISDKMIDMYERTIAQKDKYIKILGIVCLSFMGFMMAFLLIDLFNGNFGYFRY